MDRDDLGVILRAAADGNQQAWDTIVERFERLVWATVRGFRLSDEVSADIMQITWLKLVEKFVTIRDPERLGAWLATTARHECLKHLRVAGRAIPTDETEVFDRDDRRDSPALDAALLDQERDRALADAFLQISESCQELLRLLTADPPLAYEDIAEMLGRPVGSIGPTRARCLERLRAVLTTAGYTP